jgi:hypothetical protein
MSPPQCASLGGAVSSNVDAIGGLGLWQLPLLRAWSPIRAFLHCFRAIVLIGEDLVQVLSISHMLNGPMMLHVPSMAGHSVLNC